MVAWRIIGLVAQVDPATGVQEITSAVYYHLPNSITLRKLFTHICARFCLESFVELAEQKKQRSSKH